MGAERDRLRRVWAARAALHRIPGGPRAGMDISFRATGVVIRRALPERCERCQTALGESDALRGASPGRYPKPPRGTEGYCCAGCGHVEYVKKPGRMERLRAWWSMGREG